MVIPKVYEFYYGVCAGQGLDVPLFIKGTANVLKLEPGDFGLRYFSQLRSKYKGVSGASGQKGHPIGS